jgi:hypothetical protein
MTGNYVFSTYSNLELPNGESITSDKNLKNSIQSFSNQYDILFDNLKPVSFKYNDN